MARLAPLAALCAALAACDGDSDDDGPAPPAPPPDPVAACAQNLANLHAALLQYQADNGSMPFETGGAFWLKLSITGPPYVSNLSWYDCPVNGTGIPAGTTDYRGPAADANAFAATDPIGADKVGTHGSNAGGHVLLKDGTVSLVAESDPLWILAGTKTVP